MYASLYVCMNVYIDIYIYLHTYMPIHTYIHDIHACTCAHTHFSLSLFCIFIYIHILIYLYTYIYIYIYSGELRECTFYDSTASEYTWLLASRPPKRNTVPGLPTAESICPHDGWGLRERASQGACRWPLPLSKAERERERITHGCNINMNMPVRSAAHRTSHPSKARKRRAGLRARGALLAPYAWEKKSERERDILPSPLAPEQSKERERDIYMYIHICTHFFSCVSV